MVVKFQECERRCSCRKGVVPFGLTYNGPFQLDRASSTCTVCGRAFDLLLEVSPDNTASVYLCGDGLDYDMMSFAMLSALQRTAAEAVHRGDTQRDLVAQLKAIRAAIKRRNWELIASLNGAKRSMGRWQTKEQCEAQMADLMPAGSYVVDGAERLVEYSISESAPALFE